MDQRNHLADLQRRFEQATSEGAVSLVLGFEEFDALLGGLPQDAYTKKQWWTGTRQPHVSVWRQTGWKVSQVGFRMQRVAFVRE